MDEKLDRIETPDDLAEVERNEDVYEGEIIPVDPELAEAIIKALDLESQWEDYKRAGENLGKGPLNFLKRKQKIKVEKREKSTDETDES